ncbi:MAG: chlorophyll synthesis pathway protein BchC [Maricaulaceae bacterium]
MHTTAVVLSAPERLSLLELDLAEPAEGEVAVDIFWSGISTGTERLLWSGRMPDFPGMGYPLVPGYESVGQVRQAGPNASLEPGEMVYVPGAACYGEIRGLFGGAASTIVSHESRLQPIPAELGEQGALLALAATAQHALAGGAPADLIVGHGVFGRLLARLTLAADAPAPMVWESNPDRRSGAEGYDVIAPEMDERRDYRAIYDASGAPNLLDTLIARAGKGADIVLAGFYADRMSFDFPPAFMREVRLRCAAEWARPDLRAVLDHIEAGRLSLDGLITHRRTPEDAEDAYRTAFEDPDCLKMILDWRGRHDPA